MSHVVIFTHCCIHRVIVVLQSCRYVPFHPMPVPRVLSIDKEDFTVSFSFSSVFFNTGLVQTANIVNFLVFLRKGRHPSLSERILGARAAFSRSPGARDVAFQYVNRELLWHGFAEFLIFLLPLVDMRRAKAALGYFLSGPAAVKEEGAGSGAGQECGFCGEWPTMPHAIGCPHVFCYYCVKSHAIADGYLTCPQCGQEAAGAEPVQLQIEMTEIHARLRPSNLAS